MTGSGFCSGLVKFLSRQLVASLACEPRRGGLGGPGGPWFSSRHRSVAKPGRWRVFGPVLALSLPQVDGWVGGLAQGWATG